jgi:beta-phosphoglucomutase
MTRAVIFDMDGVLVDSYRAHLESWQTLAAEQGRTFSEHDFAVSFGRTSRDIIASLWGGATAGTAEIQRMDDRKEALFRERLAREFPAMPGARELIDSLRAAGFRLAVGSSGPPENVQCVLEHLGPPTLFDAIVNGRDVNRGKPDPQVFLVASERLGVPPARCVVVEDAPPGIEAARRAGMAGIALLSTGRSREDFRNARPERIVRSLSELTPQVFANLLDQRRN